MDISPKKAKKQMKHRRRCSMSYVVRGMQITIPREGLSSKHCQHQVLAWVWSNRSCHSLLVGMQKGSATLEDRLGGTLG